MSDGLLQPHGSSIIATIAAAFTVVLGWVFRREMKRIDTATAAVSNCVTREELAKILGDMRQENRDDHAAVSAKLDRVHERVDDLFKLQARP